jgi:hypothetical protein
MGEDIHSVSSIRSNLLMFSSGAKVYRAKKIIKRKKLQASSSKLR